jgi:hypothetical protein
MPSDVRAVPGVCAALAIRRARAVESLAVDAIRGARAGLAERGTKTSRAHDETLAAAHGRAAVFSHEHVASKAASHRTHGDLKESLLRELARDTPPEKQAACESAIAQPLATGCAPATAGNTDSVAPAAPGSRVAAQAESIAALVDRVEVALRDGLPALTVSLTGSAAARVEVKRTGPGEVAVRMEGRTGLGRAALQKELAGLAGALERRGLKLSSLEIC